MTRAPLPPEARALLLSLARPLRAELLAFTSRPAALVVVSRERATADDVTNVIGALRVHETGDRYAVAPLARVRALATRLAPDVAPRLEEPLPPGETWCLIFGPNGHGVAPLVWPTTRGGHAPSTSENDVVAFLRRWPATAHLTERLIPRRDARGKVSFDLAATIDVFEELLRIVDESDIAPEDLREAAEGIRAELPALHAELGHARARGTSRPN